MELSEAQRSTLAAMPAIIGHRGAAAKAPENTLEGLRRAHDEGALWVEFDVKLTKDSVPVLIHDETLDRTTNALGAVAERTWDELKDIEAGVLFGEAFKGARIPRFEDAIRLLSDLEMGANVEIKPCPERERETARATLDVIRTFWPKDRAWPLVSSFAIEAMEEARQYGPELPRGLLLTALAENWREQLLRLECTTIHLDHTGLGDAQLDALLQEQWPVAVYTVNDVPRAQMLLARGVRAVITDDPGRLIGALPPQ